MLNVKFVKVEDRLEGTLKEMRRLRQNAVRDVDFCNKICGKFNSYLKEYNMFSFLELLYLYFKNVLRFEKDSVYNTDELIKSPQKFVEHYFKGDCDDAVLFFSAVFDCLKIKSGYAVFFDSNNEAVHIMNLVFDKENRNWILFDPFSGVENSGVINRYQHWRPYA